VIANAFYLPRHLLPSHEPEEDAAAEQPAALAAPRQAK